MDRDRSVWIHVEKCGLNDINHLIATSRVDSDLEMCDDDSKIASETVKNMYTSTKHHLTDTIMVNDLEMCDDGSKIVSETLNHMYKS